MDIDPACGVSQNTRLCFPEESGSVRGQESKGGQTHEGREPARQPSCRGVVRVMVIAAQLSMRNPRNLHRQIDI